MFAGAVLLDQVPVRLTIFELACDRGSRLWATQPDGRAWRRRANLAAKRPQWPVEGADVARQDLFGDRGLAALQVRVNA
jgi:hypothetical protein